MSDRVYRIRVHNASRSRSQRSSRTPQRRSNILETSPNTVRTLVSIGFVICTIVVFLISYFSSKNILFTISATLTVVFGLGFINYFIWNSWSPEH